MTGPGKRKASLLLVVFIDSSSYAMVIPLLPFLTLGHGADATVGGILVGIHALAAALAAAPLGRLSDRIGRKPIIVITLVGTALSYLLFAVNWNLWTLAAARIMAGVMAGNVGVIHAAVSETGSPEERAKGFGLLSAAWALGFVLGPAIIALTSDPASSNPAFLPGVLAALATLGSLAFVAASLKGSPVQNAFRDVSGPQLHGGRQGTADRAARRNILAITGLVALTQTGVVATTGFWVHALFGWGPFGTSLLFLWVAAVVVSTQILAVPPLARRLGEWAALKWALALCLAALAILLTLSREVTAVVMAAPLLFAGISISATMLSAIVANSYDQNNQGLAMGLSQSVSSAGRVIGPLAFGLAFAQIGVPAPFWIALAALALCLTLLVLREPVLSGPAKESAP